MGATLDDATLAALGGDATITPSALDTAETRALVHLRVLTPGASTPGASAQLAIGAVIGAGGMGVVRAAEQIALGRTVAVKTLRPGRADATAVDDLLREAWITGSLEHPNVVPVHYLGLDREGVPLAVLERIEGVAWRTLIHDAAAVEQ